MLTAQPVNCGESSERVDQGRRQALTRFAKYTAPAMVGPLLSVEAAGQ